MTSNPSFPPHPFRHPTSTRRAPYIQAALERHLLSLHSLPHRAAAVAVVPPRDLDSSEPAIFPPTPFQNLVSLSRMNSAHESYENALGAVARAWSGRPRSDPSVRCVR